MVMSDKFGTLQNQSNVFCLRVFTFTRCFVCLRLYTLILDSRLNDMYMRLKCVYIRCRGGITYFSKIVALDFDSHQNRNNFGPSIHAHR